MKILKQILIIFAVCTLGTFLGKYIPFPSSILSLLILLILLISGIIKTHHIKETTEFILENMAFFFIPAGVKIMDSFYEFSQSIVPILLIVIITTILTFTAAFFTVAGIMRLMDKHAKEDAANGSFEK